MLGWVVKLARAIKMCAALHELARTQQRDAHQAMPYHSRGDRPLLFRGREKLRCELANKLTVKLRLVGNPDTIKDREDQQWVFWSISKPFGGFNKRVAIWAMARLNCSTASTSAELSSDRCPAMSHHSSAASARPAWVK